MKTRNSKPTNVNFIATYLYHNPGARYTDIIKSLCKWSGAGYTRGHYSSYFSPRMGNWRCRPTQYKNVHWRKIGNNKNAGWMLTLHGMEKVIIDMNMESKHG